MDRFATLTPPCGMPVTPDGPDSGAPAPDDRPEAAGTRQVQALFSVDDRRDALVAAYPELAAVCDALGFGPHHDLQHWCTEPSWMLVELARAARPPAPVRELDWSLATLPELVDELVTHHHQPLRNELNRLGVLIDELCHRWPGPAVGVLVQRFTALRDALLAHLEHEEQLVFPLCIALDESARGRRQAPAAEDATAAIRFMSLGHVQANTLARELDAAVDAAARSIDDPDLALIREALTAMRHGFVQHEEVEDGILLPAMVFAGDQVRARRAVRSDRHRIVH